jgi:hypothetical protein
MNINYENYDDYPGGVTGNHNPMLHQNLSRVIRWFKGRVTYKIRKKDDLFQWQYRFNDRVIGDMKELDATRKYIIDNPINNSKP